MDIPICGASCSGRTGRRAIRCARTSWTRRICRTGDRRRGEDRGMIYELRTYTLQPGKQPEYLKLNAEVGRKIRGDNYGILRGSWTTETGVLNQYVHLWEYPSLDE